jgi:hypothetical protein
LVAALLMHSMLAPRFAQEARHEFHETIGTVEPTK